MAKKEVIYEKRRMTLFGMLFRGIILSVFLATSFIAGGVFLNDSFRGEVKSSKFYKKILSFDYFKKLALEATPKPKIVEKKVEKIVEKIVWKTPKKTPLAYQEIKPSFGIDNFEKVEKLKPFKSAENFNGNESGGSQNSLSLFEKVREKINAKGNEEEEVVIPGKLPSSDKKASLDLDQAKVQKMLKEQEAELEKISKKEKETTIVKEEPIIIENDIAEVKEEIKIKPLDPNVKKIIESKAKIAKLAPSDLNKLIHNISKLKSQYDLDPIFVTAVMMKESSLNSEAISANGKLGIFQIHPLKAKEISKYSKVELRKGVSLIDLDYNMALGGGYLNFLNKMFKGNKKHVLTAYYMGIKNFISAAKAKRKLSSEVIEYRDEIISMYEEWSKTNKPVKKVISKKKKIIPVKSKPKSKKKTYLKSSAKKPKSVIRDPFKTKKTSTNKVSKPKSKFKLPKIKLVN